MYQPSGGLTPLTVKPAEVAIIGLVLIVWASAVYVFFNQWGEWTIYKKYPKRIFNLIAEIFRLGKLRSLIPYQPQYKYQPEPRIDEEANLSQCHHCDTQIRQVPFRSHAAAACSVCSRPINFFQAHTFDELFTVREREELLKRHLIKGRLNNSSIHIGPSRCGNK